MTAFRSALYRGFVGHARHMPRRHAFRYRVFMLLLDLDELETLSKRTRLFSYNRANPLSFRDADHLGGEGPLRPQVQAHLAAAGIVADGAIRLLCMPRIFGFVFNPLSVFFCHRADGGLAAILYEVNNTFGQRHCYLIPAEGPCGEPVRQSCDKAFYVSPFMDMDLGYRFRIAPPGEVVAVGVDVHRGETKLLTTSFRGRRTTFDDRALCLALLRDPLLTFKVVAGIHWEALFLWLKRIGIRARPDAPAHPVTAAMPDRL